MKNATAFYAATKTVFFTENRGRSRQSLHCRKAKNIVRYSVLFAMNKKTNNTDLVVVNFMIWL